MEDQRATLSVVIPALNEERRLPLLLAGLAEQTRPPDQLIVADAASTDRTRELAEQAGALVVEGGSPAKGRNAGAAVATGELLLFLDADDDPSPDWIERALVEFEERGLAIAGAQIEPIERDVGVVVGCEAVNAYLLLMQYVQPHAAGFCILVRRDVHEAIGGFDETLVLAEDHDYAQRASDVGKFRILRDAPMRTSMRRAQKEGLVRLALMYFYSEAHVVSGRPMRHTPFEYEFAAFDDNGKRDEASAIASLRGFLGDLSDPTGVWDRLPAVTDAEWTPDGIERLLDELTPSELQVLRGYLRHRVEILRRVGPVLVLKAKRTGRELWRKVSEGHEPNR